ncbi:MAG TPA: hypothetical protein GXZ96_06205 [Firmicutes bacterium]|jgi:hypothetical protein|nr:hypothetical protein [Bacillota bacterium]
MLVCPVCHGHTIGKVGANRFYCRECCLEFSESRRGLQAYRLDDEGELVQLDRDEWEEYAHSSAPL